RPASRATIAPPAGGAGRPSRERRQSRATAVTDAARPPRGFPLLEPQPYEDLHLYNSLTGEQEPFEPLDDRVVRMYVCGVTPYDVGHLGHALTYVVFDTLRRWLEFQAYEVRHVQNITDVD